MASAILSLLVLLAASAGGGGATVATATGAVPAGSDLTLPVVFPEHEVTQDDAYLCTAVKLPDKPLKLVGIESTSDQRIVHHMLLFGERGGTEALERHAGFNAHAPPSAPCLHPHAPLLDSRRLLIIAVAAPTCALRLSAGIHRTLWCTRRECANPRCSPPHCSPFRLRGARTDGHCVGL